MFKKSIILIICITICNICYAELPCLNKTEIKNYSFNIHSKPYHFTTYRCDDENGEFLKPTILEVKSDDMDYQFKNLIGLFEEVDIKFINWMNKPTFFYSGTRTHNTEAYIPITIRDSNLTADCVYVRRRLINLMKTQYSYCIKRQTLNSGDSLYKFLISFSPESINSYAYFPHTDESLSYKDFDVLVAKMGDINFYQRYQSIEDYDLDKYTVIMANKDKQYHFNNVEVFQRMVSSNSLQFPYMIGLDILDSSGHFTFYDMKKLSALLDKSTKKRDIHSYIQLAKVQLYEQPDFQYPTDNYLKRNNFVKILDIERDENKIGEIEDKNKELLWFKVSYHSKKNGEIINWIPWNSFRDW
jgi:hypothetical protein